jgi:hypothetical protein
MPGEDDHEEDRRDSLIWNATIIEFDFTCPDPTVVSFQYVFGSEESGSTPFRGMAVTMQGALCRPGSTLRG